MRCALVLAIVSACGFPALDNKAASDANGSSDGVPGGDGSNTNTDAGIDAVVRNCGASAAYGTPTPVDQTADLFLQTSEPLEELEYTGRLTNEALPDYLYIDMLAHQGGGEIQPGAYMLKPTDNTRTCDECVLILASCNNCNPFDTGGSGEYYLATGGTLNLSSVSSKMTGTLTNATFVHVLIANAGSNPTYMSTPLNDGCTTTITSINFSVNIQTHVNGSLSRSRRLAK